MAQQFERDIFRQASTTYYWSSRFFPKAVRNDVFKLYSFVRTADDYVDAQPQKRAAFRQLRRRWEQVLDDPHGAPGIDDRDELTERVIKNMYEVYNAYGFDAAWVTSFLNAMQADLDGKTYATLEDTLWYVHGSAEVIGLMMAKILNLSPEAYEAARLQGRAMQWINFIRDIREDYAFGRQYFPEEDLRMFGLPDLSPDTVRQQKAAFKKFVAFELGRYHEWQKEAALGFKHIPRRPRIALRTAVDMYDWTGAIIAARPHIVLETQVKPSKRRVLRQGFIRIVRN